MSKYIKADAVKKIAEQTEAQTEGEKNGQCR